MNNINDKMLLQRVSIESLFEVLDYLYERGADYVDILVEYQIEENNKKVINLGFSAKPEYYIEEEQEQDVPDIDLNDLIV